jgi:hypothetical protein
MHTDIRTLLEDAAGGAPRTRDAEALVRRGRARRTRQQVSRAVSASLVLVLVAVVGAQVLRDLQRPTVMFDAQPRPGAGTWETVPDAPLASVENAVAVDLGDGTVLVVGGRRNVPNEGDAGLAQAARYDVRARRWTALPDVPFALDREDTQNAGSVMATATGDGRAIAWREWASTPPAPFVAALFDPDAQEWQVTGEAPLSPRLSPLVGWIDGRLVVWGGSVEGEHEPAEGGAVWTPGRGWERMAQSPLAPRVGAATAVVEGRLLVWGGVTGAPDDGDQVRYDDGALYDPETNAWVSLPPSPLSARDGAAAAVDGDGVLIAGGAPKVTVTERPSSPARVESTCDPSGVCTATATAEVGWTYDVESPGDGARYDLSDGTWTALPEPPPDTGISGGPGFDHLTASGADSRYRFDPGRGAWLPYPYPRSQFAGGTLSAIYRVGELDVSLGHPGMVFEGRLGGAVLREDEWERLAEADTAARAGAAITPVGDEALFVWGGTSVIPGEDPYGPYFESHQQHTDGALWRP